MKKIKGFTLIEIIVVIAIIGVLAAILVPAMAGYIKKSKISSANDDASSIMKAVSIACSEMDEEEIIVPDGDYYSAAGSATLTSSVSATGNFTLQDFYDAITPYMGEIEGYEFAFTVKDNMCMAVATKTSNYFGSKPTLLSNKNYNTHINSSTTCNDVLLLAKNKFNSTHPADQQI